MTAIVGNNQRQPGCVAVQIGEDLAIADSLPPRVRRALQQAAVPIASGSVQVAVWTLGEEATLGMIERAERAALAIIARAYQQQCGTPYPSAAAGASILRG